MGQSVIYPVSCGRGSSSAFATGDFARATRPSNTVLFAPAGVPRARCRGGGQHTGAVTGAGGDCRRRAPERVLSFFHTHTGERLKVAYCCGGEYQPDGLAEVNHILRDFRVNETRAIEPGLLDLLHELGGTLDTDQPFHVISGYRSRRRPTGCSASAAARRPVSRSHSLHMVGQAIDIRVPGVKLERLRDAARSLQDRRRRLLSRSRLRARGHRSRPLLVAPIVRPCDSCRCLLPEPALRVESLANDDRETAFQDRRGRRLRHPAHPQEQADRHLRRVRRSPIARA